MASFGIAMVGVAAAVGIIGALAFRRDDYDATGLVVVAILSIMASCVANYP